MASNNIKPKNNFNQQLEWAKSISENNSSNSSNAISRTNSSESTIFTPFIENSQR